MKFSVNYAGSMEKRSLKYWANEYSFDTEPPVVEIVFDAVLNKLNLTVVENGRIVQVWGYCPYGAWQNTHYSPPSARQGELKVVDELEPGFSYRINSESESDWTEYYNRESGWICIGSPSISGHAVEFMSNCISVISDDGDMVSLWLRPEGSIPK